jgi:hypothetical protein
MPLLGNGGRLELRREWPEAVVLKDTNVNYASNSILLRNQAFWTGDQVRLVAEGGLPFDLNGDTYADCPDGHGVYYGSNWALGPNRTHLTGENNAFYKSTGDPAFYATPGTTGSTAAHSAYIYRDPLDRVSFYATEADAINGLGATRLPIKRVGFGNVILAADGSLEYQNALLSCAGDVGDYRFSDIEDEVTLTSICAYAPNFEQPYPGATDYDNADVLPRSNADGQPWLIQAWLSEWTLNLSGTEVDTTAVGEKFGDSVKALITGGGSLDFLLERQTRAGHQDPTALMRLLLLVQKGCKAEAKFSLMLDRSASTADSDCSPAQNLAGDLYYQCEILITSTAINTRADQLIAGSADFVTTGPIALKMGVD